MLQAMAWVILLSPRIGFINKTLQSAVRSQRAAHRHLLAWRHGLRRRAALRADRFSDAGAAHARHGSVAGRSRGSLGRAAVFELRKVTLRLLAPGLVAVMIYQAMTALEVFEIPGILGLPAGIHVFSTKIYAIVRSATFLPVYGQANALAMVYLFIAVVTTFFYTRLIAGRNASRSSPARGIGRASSNSAKWRYLALGLVCSICFSPSAAVLGVRLHLVSGLPAAAVAGGIPGLHAEELSVLGSSTVKSPRP